jgi:recombination protein RecT
MSAMMGAVLDLPINQNLGFAYIVPYGDKAQFQIGVRGLVQLAQRSGQFKTISSTPVYDGQLKSQDPLKGFEFDWSAKTSDKVIGFVAYFSLINGFEKTLFMSIDEVSTHGKKYSKTFGNKYGVWQTDFNAMGEKTVLKRLLSKFAPLSIDMQKAIVVDQSVIKDAETLDVQYVDNEETPLDKERERMFKFIEKAKSLEQLDELNQAIINSSLNEDNSIWDAYTLKLDQLKGGSK